MARKPYTKPEGPSAIDKALERYAEVMIDHITKLKDSDWKKPWMSVTALPRNIDGRDCYHGANNVLLTFAGMAAGYKVPGYMTSFQLNKLNFVDGEREKGRLTGSDGQPLPFVHVKKGERAFPVIFHMPKIYDSEGKPVSQGAYDAMSEAEKDECKKIPFMRVYQVFNIDQTNIEEVRSDLYEKIRDKVLPKLPEKDPNGGLSFEALDRMVAENRWLCPIRPIQQDQAFYDAAHDAITIPMKAQFKEDESYYGTMTHEMAHSTGHKDRLDRLDKHNYGREELVAELTSAYVMHTQGISKEVKEESRQYLTNWLEQLHQDPTFLKDVLADVNKASRLITQEIEKVKLNESEKASQEATVEAVVAEPAEDYGKTTQDHLAASQGTPVAYRYSMLAPTQKYAVEAMGKDTVNGMTMDEFVEAVESFTRDNEQAELRKELQSEKASPKLLEKYMIMPESIRTAVATLKANVPGYDAKKALEEGSPAVGITDRHRPLVVYPAPLITFAEPRDNYAKGQVVVEAPKAEDAVTLTAAKVEEAQVKEKGGKNQEAPLIAPQPAIRQDAVVEGKSVRLPPLEHYVLASKDGELAHAQLKTLSKEDVESISRRYVQAPLGEFDAIAAIREAASKTDLSDGRPSLQKWLVSHPNKANDFRQMTPGLAMRVQQSYTFPRRVEDGNPAALISEMKEYAATFDDGGYEDYEKELEHMDPTSEKDTWWKLYKDEVPEKRQAQDKASHESVPGSVNFANVALFYAELNKQGKETGKISTELNSLPGQYAAAYKSLPEHEQRLVALLRFEQSLPQVIEDRMKAYGREKELEENASLADSPQKAEEAKQEKVFSNMMPVEQYIAQSVEAPSREAILEMYSELSITQRNEINLRYEASGNNGAEAVDDIVAAARTLRENVQKAITQAGNTERQKTLGEVLRSFPEGKAWAERIDKLPAESQERMEKAFHIEGFRIGVSLPAEEGRTTAVKETDTTEQEQETKSKIKI